MQRTLQKQPRYIKHFLIPLCFRSSTSQAKLKTTCILQHWRMLRTAICIIFFHWEPATRVASLKKKSNGIDSHESVGLTNLSLCSGNVGDLFPVWIGGRTPLTGLLPFHVFLPIVVLMSSFFTRLPLNASRCYGQVVLWLAERIFIGEKKLPSTK